jgi:hypothetical protein
MASFLLVKVVQCKVLEQMPTKTWVLSEKWVRGCNNGMWLSQREMKKIMMMIRLLRGKRINQIVKINKIKCKKSMNFTKINQSLKMEKWIQVCLKRIEKIQKFKKLWIHKIQLNKFNKLQDKTLRRIQKYLT